MYRRGDLKSSKWTVMLIENARTLTRNQIPRNSQVNLIITMPINRLLKVNAKSQTHSKQFQSLSITQGKVSQGWKRMGKVHLLYWRVSLSQLEQLDQSYPKLIFEFTLSFRSNSYSLSSVRSWFIFIFVLIPN